MALIWLLMLYKIYLETAWDGKWQSKQVALDCGQALGGRAAQHGSASPCSDTSQSLWMQAVHDFPVSTVADPFLWLIFFWHRRILVMKGAIRGQGSQKENRQISFCKWLKIFYSTKANMECRYPNILWTEHNMHN